MTREKRAKQMAKIRVFQKVMLIHSADCERKLPGEGVGEDEQIFQKRKRSYRKEAQAHRFRTVPVSRLDWKPV